MTQVRHVDMITTSKDDVLALPLGKELWIIACERLPNLKLQRLYSDVLYKEVAFGNLVRELRDSGQFSTMTRIEIKMGSLVSRLKKTEKRVNRYCTLHHWERSDLLTSE